MNAPPSSAEPLSRRTSIGIAVFVFLCGIPALEMNGFGLGLPIPLSTALVCSFVGGIIGGALICPRPLMAGVIGGAIAGPLGLLAVYYYTGFRESVWHLELVLIQGIAGLPGIGVGLLIKRFSSFLDPSNAGFEESAAGRPE